MVNDRSLGSLILIGSVVGVLVYLYLILIYPLLILQITAFVAVAALLGILAWIGYTMATTPPAAPVEPDNSAPVASDESSQPEVKD